MKTKLKIGSILALIAALSYANLQADIKKWNYRLGMLF
jgi:hypothetical protein